MATSCQMPRYVRSAAACPLPPPPPSCLPGSFDAVTYDTTTNTAVNASYWAIDLVSGADTELEEYGLLFPSKNSSVLVIGYDKGSAGYRGMLLRAVDTVSSDGSKTLPPITTEVRPGAIMGDASLVKDGVALAEPLNKPVFWDGHATISPDGKWMVFASDRPGGLGGTDLWSVRITSNNSYGTPHRCSNIINTPCDEISPQFTPDGLGILFSSAGHATVGGYDVFKANFRADADSLVFSTVENIGKPINTTFDEVFPVQTDATTLYYGSNQQRSRTTERRDFDVYVLHRITNPSPSNNPRQPVAVVPAPDSSPELPTLPAERATITGVVVNQETQLPVADAEVTARERTTRVVISSTRTDSNGRYSLEVPVDTPVDVSAQSSELFYDGFQVNVPKERKNDTIVRDAPIALPITYILRVNFPTSVFDKPYDYTLDSNAIETSQLWTAALDELAANVRSSISRLKRLVLIGHTDDVDSDASNMKLGKQRVDFTIRELVKRGVPQELMEGRSAGERLKPDRRPGEPLDTWRKRCRRVELVKVLL
ncbi:MAG: PD40 domain-containing protein [Candidatus Kapabacteria bacterium]|nr:PD40 domain-containing protein [Candidatus Kapabacteria bacterium]